MMCDRSSATGSAIEETGGSTKTALADKAAGDEGVTFTEQFDSGLDSECAGCPRT